MLNNNITNVLQEVQKITNSIILKYPRTIANSPAGDMLVSMNMAKLDSESFDDIGIYNLSEFLNTFKLFGDERIVSKSDTVIMIRDGNMSVDYITNSISLLKEYDKSESIFDGSDAVPTVAEFELNVTDISKINQASKIFSDLEDVVFNSTDGEVTISLSASNKFNAQSNKFNIVKTAQTTKEFQVSIPIQNFNNIPSSIYKFQVKYNSERNAYRLLLKSTEIEDFSILMTVKV